ncbi:MAG: UDP-3-O-(3-hydroxymyristoyl)glucosamine N-acyltransferase, partial [Terriglobales bacterium]
ELLQCRLSGEGETKVSGVASIKSASAGDLVFVEDEKGFAAAIASPASAIIAGEFALSHCPTKPLLVSVQPKLTFARAAKLLCNGESSAERVHPTAVVHSSARIAERVTIGARVVIEEHAEIGEGTSLGAGCVIGKDVRIGKDCLLYPNVTIYAGTHLADRIIVHAGAVLGSDGFGYVRDHASGRYEKFPQIGRLEIDDDVEIGANSTIDRGALDVTTISRGTKIDNLVHIGHNCQIGEDVIIAAQTGLSGSITIEKDVVLGGQVGIGEHARIEEGVMLGGQGGVLPNKVLRGKGMAFWGTPARPVREYLKQLAALERLAKKD